MRYSTNVRRGFTLIEIMVVVVILGILAAAVVGKFIGETDKAKVSRAKSDIAEFMTALERFHLDMDRYPTSDEGLAALKAKPEGDEEDRWKGPYLQKLSKDPWGHVYVYESPGAVNEDYDLLSYGKDGVEGGEGYNADIVHWADDMAQEGKEK